VKRLACLSFALLFVLAGCGAGGSPADPSALSVNGTSIPRSQLEAELAFLAANPSTLEALAGTAMVVQEPGAKEGVYSASAGALLASIHVQTLVFTEFAADQGVEITDEDTQQAELQVDQLGGAIDPTTGQPGVSAPLPSSLRSMLIDLVSANGAIQRSVAAGIEIPEVSEIADADVQAAFDEMVGNAETCVSAIFLAYTDDIEAVQDPAFEATDEQAADALARAAEAQERLAAGEDFATVASELSDDEPSAAEGGVLGCGTSEQLASLSPPAVELEVGAVTESEETPFGYQIVRIDSRDEPVFDEQADTIRQELEQQAAAAAQEEATAEAGSLLREQLEEFVASIEVRVDPRFGTWEADQLAVVPPAGSTPAPTLPVDGPMLPDDFLDGLTP